MRRALGKTLMIGAGLGAAVLGRDSLAKRLRRGVETLERRTRYAVGRLEGLQYRFAGRGPDPAVPDDVLADRIRSTLGGVEKRLDAPHVHVMVEDHVALLHGDVPTGADKTSIEWTVLDTPGVRGIESYLHSDVRELASEPRREGDAVTRLRTVAELVAAVAARDGMSPERAQAITESVLAHLRRLVPEEVEDVAAVLPEELRQLWTTAVPG